MWTRMLNRPRGFAAAVVLTFGWGLSQATAGLPDLPPFVPPPVHSPPPVITPPPIHSPPPVAHTPEPASIVLGVIGAGIGGLVARRRKRAAAK
ncbi:MAG TPA: PEP-CTERM sorting domain-containing protein [Gemmataceae bacterium]|nr:PEP-CTERM sorting domain-containing protein [Gemmataceae bacterium]